MKFTILLVFLFMSLANPIAGGKLFPGFNNPEKWMKRVIRKLQRKTSAYGSMIASNTAEISYNAGFISSMKCDGSGYINDPDNGLSCCYEDNLNEGQCLCNGMTIDDTSNPGSCCMANQEHPDHCLCSGTDMDDPTNPGNCCFANSGQCLCTGNYTDDSSKRCFNLDWKGDGICDDQNNHGGCNFDGGDCCGDDVDTDLCTQCQCLEEEAPLSNAVGCCYKEENNSQECLCTGTEIDDPDNPGSCCMDDLDNPGNCYLTCPDVCTNPSQGICDTSTGICDCKPGFVGHNCAEACTANQITNADICQDCSAGEVPDVMSNLTACVACNPEEITNNGSCQACPECEHIFSINGDVSLTKGNLAWSTSDWSDEFKVEYDVIVYNHGNTDWANMLHVSTGSNYPRFPAVHLSRDKFLEVCFHVGECQDYYYELNKECHFEISQQRNPSGEATYRIKINGDIFYEIVNTAPLKFENVKLYLSNPWVPSFAPFGKLSNLKVNADLTQ